MFAFCTKKRYLTHSNYFHFLNYYCPKSFYKSFAICSTVPREYLNGAADNRANSVMTFVFVFFVFVNSAREKDLGTCQQR